MEKRRSWKFCIARLCAFSLIFALYLTTLNPEISDLSGDSARFLLLAKSLAQGKGYREIEKPARPPHAEYMPGLPLMLAAIYHFAPGDLRPMKILMVISAALSVICFYLLLLREQRGVRLVLTLGFAVIPFLFSLQTEILADLPSLALLLLGFACFEKLKSRAEARFRPWILSGLVMALAFYFRQTALFAFASGAAVILVSKDLPRLKILAGFALGFLPPVSLWYIRNLLLTGALEPSYGRKLFFARASDPFAGTLTWPELAERVFRRIWFFNLHLEKDILLGPYWRGLLVLWIILLIFLLVGFFYELVLKKNIAAIFYIPCLVAISSWEGWVPRYLLPFLPLNLWFIFRGLELALGKIFKNRLYGQWLAGQVFVLWFFFNLMRALAVIYFQHTPLPYPPEKFMAQEKEAVALIGVKNFAHFPNAFDWKRKSPEYLTAKSAAYYHFFAMAEWVKKNLPPETVVVCRKPTLFAWLSQGRSIQYPAELNAEKFLAALQSRGGEYVLIEEISPELRTVLLEFWKSHPERLKLQKQLAGTLLLKLD